jgi:hypothetical protein
MGQRGGTRAGETAKRLPIQETPTHFKNINGVNVPITNGVSTSWATSTMNTAIKPAAGVPYAGVAPSKRIPTKVVGSHKG